MRWKYQPDREESCRPILAISDCFFYDQTLSDPRRTVAYPHYLFVVLPSIRVQLMATHICLVFSNRSLKVLFPSSYHCWLERHPGICEVSSFHSFIPLCRTLLLDQVHNHTQIMAVTAGNPWPAITEEPKNWDGSFSIQQLSLCVYLILIMVALYMECRSETCCTRLTGNAGPKKTAKNATFGHNRTTLSGYVFATKARIGNQKKTFYKTAMSPPHVHVLTIWWTEAY